MMTINPDLWAREVFGTAQLGDKRRTNRLVVLASSLALHTGESLVKSSHSAADMEAAYRLIRNSAVDSNQIAEAGFVSCAQQVGQYGLLLALEDTTSLNFSHSSIRDELGHISNHKSQRGIFAHSVLLYSPEHEQLLGLIEQSRWTRDLNTYGKKRKRGQVPYEEKESYKWQQASERISERLGGALNKVISVCDREADIYEYLAYKSEHNQRFLVRSLHNRRLSDNDDRLYYFTDQLQPAGTRQIDIMQRGGRKARTVMLDIRFSAVCLKAPDNKEGDDISMYYVGCSEQDQGGLHWHLLTSETVETAEEAQKIVEYYEHRWLIEDYHKAWKTGGTEVEDQRMQSLENMERMIVILAFVATRVLQLRFIGIQGSKSPEQNCESVLSPLAWKLLWLKREKSSLPDQPPSLYWAYLNLAKLAGWYDSKRTGRVGWPTLWEGWFKLQSMIEGYMLAQSPQNDL